MYFGNICNNITTYILIVYNTLQINMYDDKAYTWGLVGSDTYDVEVFIAAFTAVL